MNTKKEKNVRLPLSLAKKIILAVLAIAVVVALIYLIYYLIRFKSYIGYKKYITTYDYEQGTDIRFINETKPDVPGFKLVAENEYLKLYTDTDTCNVAVYDKRNGSVSYTNPLNADEDTVAKKTNKNFLKSQFILSFYNSTANSANMDSYSKCVADGNYRWEGINGGIRYIYMVGEPTEVGKEGKTYFVIPLEYRLDGDSLMVNVPASGIEEHGNGFVSKIQLLRYMASSSYDDEGYMVVPNGSGSVIYFNNGKKNADQYSQHIYGIDPMIANFTQLETADDAKLPVYGLCYKDRSVMATVEGGAEVSTVSANVSGVYNDYNYVYSTFVIRNVDNLEMFGNAKVETNVMEEKFYDINLGVRYSFLTDEYKGYSGMANYCREKLIKEGKLKPNGRTGDIPFYYDIISGVKETGHFLGVGYLHVFSMTDFKEAEEIAAGLKEAGITNQIMNLQGWFNDGYYHDAADKIKVNGKLGGRSGLKDLQETLNSLGGKLYGDVCFQKVTFADDGFNYNAEGSRYYGGGYVAAFGQNDPSTLRNTASLGYYETRYDLLSPRFLPRYVEKFCKKINKFALDGISLRDLGNTLQSDKKRTNVIDRNKALDVVIGQFEILRDTGKSIMVDAANAYAFAYADDIINVPTGDNDFFICDESIPFYQMIIHGCVGYSSKILNYVDTYREKEMLLQLIETGTSPHYQFTAEEASRMKNTGLNRFYASTYDTHVNEAVETYNYVNEALKHVEGAMIVEHKTDGDLRKITYSNGVTILINYGAVPGTIDGITVPAEDYRMEGI